MGDDALLIKSGTQEFSAIEQLEKQVFDLKELFEISKSLNSTLDFTILIDSLLLICMAQLKVLKVGLLVRKHLDSEEFSLHRNYTGFEIDHTLAYTIPEKHDLIRFFNKQYGCYTIDEIRDNGVSLEGLDPILELNPSLLIPLQAQGRINGIIMMGERIDEGDFDSYEKKYILNVATLASIAINNAVLFEMATTDMMTKLKLKHYLFSVLNEWLDNAKTGECFSLLMFDIDFFKKVNDTYGHSCGDDVLRNVAQIIIDNTRSSDVAARYGGEEFVVLISHPGKSMALKIAERIRKTIETTKFKYKDVILGVTISCGIACYDKDRDVSGEAMIERADQALYQSKQNGRNRITLS
ncbi:diguanylate cyclase (GGDEF) domain protein [Treponema primitia ZAS-2]|uniref:diguanylate cyclase n=1 Tax=Treponema primitia (strain ATCC BAA-887 / DSM 12427 / ZAS-2) TaxID=545694 RepID=F5YM52_TREPZ|nr:diguanylate cyclase DgcA [Treponema primitia]AEF84853.1 diguanylate cyclase (GGDEF) domain protein [Treponema primitia ZAS-2]